MRFDWIDLQVFMQVCEAGSMTAAADRCHLSLAAVSARIRGLEEAHGVVLLQRTGRGVAPTVAGAVLVRHARVVFAQVQELQRDLLQASASPARPFVLLANSSALARPLLGALTELPPAPLVVRESSSEASVQALRSGAADLAIVSDAVDTRGLASDLLGPDPLVLLLPPTHPLAARGGVRFHEALQLPWIACGEHSALSTHLLLRAAALGLRMQVRVSYPQAAGVLDAVARGLGVTVLPQALVAAARGAPALAWVPLDEPWARRRLLACRSTADPVRRQVARQLALRWPGLG